MKTNQENKTNNLKSEIEYAKSTYSAEKIHGFLLGLIAAGVLNTEEMDEIILQNEDLHILIYGKRK